MLHTTKLLTKSCSTGLNSAMAAKVLSLLSGSRMYTCRQQQLVLHAPCGLTMPHAEGATYET